MADSCDELIRRIDKSLKIAKLKPNDAERVRGLRLKGMTLRKAGHSQDECMDPLMEAAILLGLEAPAKK
jgi:hypothetical protein